MTPEKLRYARNLMADQTRSIPDICRELGGIPASALYDQEAVSAWERSIPACAGEPRGVLEPARPAWVYPRVCGGTMRISPGGFLQRSIPACAGEPEAKAVMFCSATVYPRVCGGTARASRPPVVVYPRVCGGTSLAWPPTRKGSIPACAGEPQAALRNKPVSTVHTRSIPACAGEPLMVMLRRQEAVYPRVCGGTCSIPRRQPARSIPACAGEPAVKPGPPHGDTVYPRVCGGTVGLRTPKPAWKGLSPRVRGNRQGQRPISPYRVYPRVCGGTSATRRCGTVKAAVYPRVCGGTHAAVWQGHRNPPAGLSPRVRGNRAWQTLELRSIPACAGEPSPVPRGIANGSIPACAGEPSLHGPDVERPRGCRSIPACAGEPFFGECLIGRSIPACAGEPRIPSRHPRQNGLSPRVRGNLRSVNES